MKRTWIALALLALGGAVVGAQNRAEQPQSLEDVHARMLELMNQVETRLKTIDGLLNDASARDKQLTAGGAAAVDRVLVESRDRARQNLEDIDEILRLSVHPHPEGSGSGCCKGGGLCQATSKSKGGSGNKPGNSASGNKPGNNESDGRAEQALAKGGETPSQRESTPTGQKPGEQPGDQSGKEKTGEKPGDKPGGMKPGENGNDPRNPYASKALAKNSPSGGPPKSSTGAVSTSSATDRWGDLPVYARDVFRAQGGEDLPMRYRDFIDGYHRRLNETK
jgi:hypothetical protein